MRGEANLGKELIDVLADASQEVKKTLLVGVYRRYLEATRDSLLDFGWGSPGCWNRALEKIAGLGL